MPSVMHNNDVLLIRAPEVEAALKCRKKCVLNAVQKAYEMHSRGASSLPHSSFLRFPDSDKDRIICLPAYLGGDYELAGVKWIASMPDNVARGMERAVEGQGGWSGKPAVFLPILESQGSRAEIHRGRLAVWA